MDAASLDNVTQAIIDELVGDTRVVLTSAYLIPFDDQSDNGTVLIRPCIPIGTGVAYRYRYETLDYRTTAITPPVVGMRISDYFSEFNRLAMDDEGEGVLFWSTGGVTHTCALSRVFSKAPPPFSFCSSEKGSKHYDCAALNWLDVYKACKERGYYSEDGYGLVPIKTRSFFPEVFCISDGKYYANYDSWGLQNGQWLKEFIRDDIGSFNPDEFMDKGVTINGASATSYIE